VVDCLFHDCWNFWTVGSNCQTPLWTYDYRPCLNDRTYANNASYSSLLLRSSPMDVSNIGFSCHYLIGFTGPRCEFRVDWCRGLNGNVGVFSNCKGNVGGSRQRELLYTMTLAAVKMNKMYSDLCKLAGF